MYRILFVFIALVLFSCKEVQERPPFSSVSILPILEDSTLSIRALEVMQGNVVFAANKGVYGMVDGQSGKVKTNVQQLDSLVPEFRAVAHTATDFFMLSVASPALLYKTGNQGKMELVYSEMGDGVFYDSMRFWNDKEGIAVGDTNQGCLSIIVTRDGGNTWKRLDCDQLPAGVEGEGAFAASNTNIAIHGDQAWIGTTLGRIYHTADKGNTWQLYQTPVVNTKDTEGIYSLAFFDEKLGVAFGGDYTQPEGNTANKALTVDGGKTWELIASGQEPGYKSCVQFVPGSGGREMVALGFTGISYSADRGEQWKSLSDESFYTLRFLNDSVAYAAGRGRVARLVFR